MFPGLKYTPLMPTPRPAPRPAFTISPATVVVIAAFIIVAVTQLVTRMNHPAFSWPTMLWFFVISPMLIVGVIAGAAWVCAWLLVPRASTLAFNVTVIACLLVLTGLRVAFMSGLLSGGFRGTPPPAAAPIAAKPNPRPTSTPTSPAPAASPALATSAPSARNPAPGTTVAARSTIASRRAPAPASVAPPASPPPVINTAPLLDPFFGALDIECRGLAADATAAYAAVTRPGRTVEELDAQVKSFRDLAARSEAVAGRLQGIVNDGMTALAPLNMSGVDAHRAVLARDESFNSFERLGACGELAIFANSAASLFTELKTCRAKIQVDKTGSITTADKALDRALFPKRAQVDMARERAASVLKRLAGGDSTPVGGAK